ncbi:MAG TPA: cupin-like domain-containing protein [Sphingomicrobium sp.]|nr:cupin-like domain-containing protein [Sphingomicrobium sp.]
MFETLHRAAEIPASGLNSLPGDVVAGGQPTVLRGAFREWPFVRAALQSDEAAVDYLDRFYNGRPVSTIVAPPSEKGRFFYQPDSKEMNFQRSEQRLSIVLKALLREQKSDQPPGIAMQAVSAPDCLPGLERDNPNPFVPEGIHARVWIGNLVTVAPHFDVADNLACVAAGRRRFILFPPEQTTNLYPGPMDVTPANVPISMVLLGEPNFDRFPRYREALDSAFVAELEPGDAIYIPYLWWHGVQSLGSFNALVNYWWNRDESSARYPYVALLRLFYAAYRDMPIEHRRAWRALYDHYVFQPDGDPMEAISPPHRASGQPVDPSQIARLKEALRDLLG